MTWWLTPPRIGRRSWERRRPPVTSDGSAFENLAASEFKSAAREHGVEVVPGPAGAVYEPASGRLTVDPRTYELSAQLDPRTLPGKDFESQFALRYHRDPGPYAAYGYEAMGLILQAITGAGTDASSFRDNVRDGVFGAHRDGTVLGSYSITDEGDTTECMIQRYRVNGATRTPLGASLPAGLDL